MARKFPCLNLIASYFEDGTISFGGSMLYNAIGLLKNKAKDIDLIIRSDSDYIKIVNEISEKLSGKLDKYETSLTVYKVSGGFGVIDLFIVDLSSYEIEKFIKINGIKSAFYGLNQLKDGLISTIELLKEVSAENKIKKMYERLTLIENAINRK